ncbi:MAG: type IV pilus assembly protein PilM [Elusimicrobia bacterium]|nr:type IV pilus assembly protein PilM [Elusimicrobiota bacterium]
MAMKLPEIKIPSLKFLHGKDLIGVDIGTHSIKVVQLKGSSKKWSLFKWGIAPISSDGKELSPQESIDVQTATLKSLLAQTGIKTKNAAASISGNSVIVRYVKFPKLSAQELEKTIQYEAEPYIPFDIRDVNIGFNILNDITEDGQKKMETILVAAKKEVVQSRIDVLQMAGLSPMIIDVDAFAIENAFEQSRTPESNDTVLFINIGAAVTNMSIIENGVSKVVRDVFVAGNSFSKALQKNLQCDFQEAENLKSQFGLLVSAEEKEQALSEDRKDALQISTLIGPIARDLLGEVQRSLDFYLSQGSDRAVNKVLLSGGSSKIKNLDKYFAQELRLPVELFNPMAQIAGGDKVPPDDVMSLTVALGIATRRVGDSRT